MKIAVIGGGAMGTSLIEGWLQGGIEPENILAADPSAQRRQELASLGISVFADNSEAAAAAETILLAVKPQVAKKVLEELAGVCGKKQLFSIVAGLETASIEEYCPVPVVRALP